ncbi:MAG: hypothetical protein WD771_06185 [Gemmatimonadaceae bacterium]
MVRWGRLGAMAMVVAACGDDAIVAEPTVQLVDPAIPAAVAGADGWNYVRVAEGNLTGSGAPMRVVLTARVELIRGQPAWDDGQPWQVYVEAPDGRRTYVYAQRLQLGGLTMRVGLGDVGHPATVVLIEHLPDRLSVYEASYVGPDSVSVAVRFQRDVDPRGETAGPHFPPA